MAIGSAAGGVDISKNARTLFGSADDLFGGAGTSSIFAGGGSNSGEAVRASLKGLERELNRLLGFKSDFTPAQQKRLDVLQAEIGEIESKVSISTGGGAFISGDVVVEGGDFVGRDQIGIEVAEGDKGANIAGDVISDILSYEEGGEIH